MKEKEVLSTRYYIEFNGNKIDRDPKYFGSDKEAFKYFKDHVDIFSEIYNNSTSPNKFTIVEEVTSVKRSVSSTIYLKRYVVTALTNNGTQVYLSCSSDTSEVYFSSFKFRSLNYKNEKDAEYFLDVYKDILKDRYKKELLDTMKVLEVEENINYERTGYYIDVNGL